MQGGTLDMMDRESGWCVMEGSQDFRLGPMTVDFVQPVE